MDNTETNHNPDSAAEDMVPSVTTALPSDAASPELRQSLPTSRKLRAIRRFLNGFGITLALSWVAMYCLEALNDNPIGWSHCRSGFADWNHRREEVKQAFVTSWDAYAQNAWGKWHCSTLRPHS